LRNTDNPDAAVGIRVCDEAADFRAADIQRSNDPRAKFSHGQKIPPCEA
jgi:hypothetical protein